MGISGLLPFVKKACRRGNLFEYRRKCLAVDVSCLLHRGVFGCVGEIAKGNETDFYVRYIHKHVDILLKIECHVILVFDGQPLPAKKNINDYRKALREKNQKLGEKLLKEGLKKEAHRAFQQGITITRDIVENTIRAFQNVPMVDIIVAPYEADAQIAYLLQNNLAYAAITEDSDLIVFGCERIIFKMDLSGSCLTYDKSKLANCICPAIAKRFEFEIFRRICILAGCDYLQGGLQGIGLKKAEIFFTKTTQNDLRVILPRLPLYLNMSSVKVDKLFIEEFIKAENTFLYQIVFDPITRKHTPLNPYPTLKDDLTHNTSISTNSMPNFTDGVPKSKFLYAGEISPPNEALRRALGNIDFSRAPVQDEFILIKTPPDWSIWSGTRFLKLQTCEQMQREHIAAPKQSPKPGYRDEFPRSSLLINSTKKMGMKRISLVDIDKKNENEGGQDEENGEKCLIFRKRKLQRRSEPMEILANTRPIKHFVHTQTDETCQNRKYGMVKGNGNGSTLKWNSAEWMKMYGVAIMSNTSTLQVIPDMILPNLLSKNTSCLAEEEISSNNSAKSTPPLNPFSKEDKRNFEAVTSNSKDDLAVDSVESCTIKQLSNFRKCGKSNIGVFRQTGCPLVDVLGFSSSPLSSAVRSVSSTLNNRQSSFYGSQASSSSSSTPNTVSPVVSQEVFYRRRNSFSLKGQSSASSKSADIENLSISINANVKSDAGKGENYLNDKLEATNNEVDDNILISVDHEKMAATTGAKISPYFFNNKFSNNAKIGASGYRPSGLRRRAPTNSFPRVL